MILVALGSNSAGPWGTPREAVAEALRHLDRGGISLVKASKLLVTAPFGVTDQPDFVNAVAELRTALSPEELLAQLHGIERQAGRERTLRWGPRTLDLDLIDYHGLIRSDAPPLLPHPGIAERIFVLAPIAEIAPQWRHPVTELTAAEMLARLDHEGEGRLL
ncbi:2-amino-4-hydroxy-6-hydroxymethyldihydropteridine diphosphokinase [Aestuariivirga litoralis]|uniref:2-amino-4-hydroxy-6-hydroxymethyldihydropteridine pyrophosphokinase n=1 Tax=Aestuariivirga litoralis TaxID=2650924 RepID=A0A2W2BJ87_9HYPH|nr:2-amino-4-hydroxy-6-hydroxymethyldihydropteridine diphosphokinase [Aestuariivirga litoralis]PZF76249.1 2-amino-4-hydroxy-6-hydroxymethyldihydropteridine diphosphokinase [Aestuariivirga litoralis]